MPSPIPASGSIEPRMTDAAAVEALGHWIALLENPHPNPKLTSPQDLAYLEFLLAPAP